MSCVRRGTARRWLRQVGRDSESINESTFVELRLIQPTAGVVLYRMECDSIFGCTTWDVGGYVGSRSFLFICMIGAWRWKETST